MAKVKSKTKTFSAETRAKIAEKAREREARKRIAKAGGPAKSFDSRAAAIVNAGTKTGGTVTLSSRHGSVTFTGETLEAATAKMSCAVAAPVIEPVIRELLSKPAPFRLSPETARRVARAFRDLSDANSRLGVLQERRAGAKRRAQGLESEAEGHAAADPELRDGLRTARMGEIAQEMKTIETDLAKIATDIGSARAEIKSARKTRDALLRGEDPRGTLYEEVAETEAAGSPDGGDDDGGADE